MALYVVATPIGNPDDLSPRAARILRESPVVIGEEWKELKALLRQVEAPAEQELYVLNEHSEKEDLDELIEVCKVKDAALVTDCGTPAFCDPGSDLVKACYENAIAVKSLPGPSSLACFISLCGVRLDQFVFRGFLPARGDDRDQAIVELKDERRPIILMDTPYRLKKLLEDLKTHLPQRELVLGLDLSTDSEMILRGSPGQVLKALKTEKAEFMLMLEGVGKASGGSTARKSRGRSR